jgi:hypothetical protein
MKQTTLNGNVPSQTLHGGASLPAASPNPFLVPAWDTPLARDLAVPAVPGGGERLTKKQHAIIEEGGAQLLQQHFQRVKAGYAIAASAQIEDLASRAFTHVGGNIARRTVQGLHPPELQPYLELYMDAALRRFAPELLQIASDHHRTQNQIAGSVIEIDEEGLAGFWERLLRPGKGL